jgi:hypothetical protein
MLQVKTEDGKKIDVARKDFKEIDAVLEHAIKTLNLTPEYCLCTEKLQGSCGVIVTKF